MELPLGLGMALAQNEKAMTKFTSMSDKQKNSLINKAHAVQSKTEMAQLVNSLTDSAAN